MQYVLPRESTLARKLTRGAGIALVWLVALVPAVHAAFPQDPPNDPEYDRAEGNCLTESVNDEQHYFYSFVSQCTPAATSEPDGAAGMSIDAAWKDFTIGGGDTTIAYVEGGINWRDNSVRELADRVFLNAGELPDPTTPDADPKTLNARDYADTPDRNGNGLVDPEDVIVRFSNGADEDGNGYTDDISGWDFYNDQNDPATVDSEYDHANNQEEQAAAETDNAFQQAGICPRCMILPIKAGAEALDRTDDLAEAWLYAADMKADVIASVTADLGYSTFMREAVEYAWDRNVLMVEASNDFDSTDHQGGHFWPHVVPGNGLVPNTVGIDAPPAANAATTSYRIRSGQTSWGTKNFLSVSTQGGSTSESTPTHAGVYALVLAYGKQAAAENKIDGPLTNAEALQVVRDTASDIATPEPWPGKPGFDLQYGYGRPNVHRAMQAIAAGNVPPVGWIDSPDWYALYDPSRTSSVPVTGRVEARRASGYTWKLEFAPGAEPDDGDYVEGGSGGGSAPFDGSLGALDLGRVPRSFWEKAFTLSERKELETNEHYTVTLRLRVTDSEGRVGEERRTIAVQHDPTWSRGFPKRIGPGGEGQPVLADLQGTGRLAAIFGDADGNVHAIDGVTGNELPGWPATTNATQVARDHSGVSPRNEPIVQNAAVGDLDHTGEQSVVVTSTSGRVYVFDERGKRRAGWPKALDRDVAKPPIPRPDRPYRRDEQLGATAPPVLHDLDGDARLDVIQGGWNGFLYAWKASGEDLPGWPVKVKLPDDHTAPPGRGDLIDDRKLITPPTIADLDGDGKAELVQRSQYANITAAGIQPGGVGYVHAYRSNGSPVPGYPIPQQSLVMYYGSAQEFITEGSTASSAADVDGDGADEFAEGPIFTPTSLYEGDGSLARVYGSTTDAQAAIDDVLDNPGNVLDEGVPGTDVPVTFTASGAFGRFGPSRRLVFAQPGSAAASIAAALLLTGSGFPINNVLRVNDAATGAQVPGFAAKTQGLDFLGAPAIADLTGDGAPEILEGGDSSALHGFEAGGGQAEGFPKFHTGWVLYGPSTGDLDSDGTTDVAVTTREGYLMAWETKGVHAGNQEWWSAHHDERNTRRYGMDTRPPGVPRNTAFNSTAANVTFTAPGDDWYGGQAKSYLLTFSTALRQAGAPSPTVVAATKPAGERETVGIPAGTRSVRLQAVDEVGNLGRAVTVRGAAATGAATPTARPSRATRRLRAADTVEAGGGRGLPFTGLELLLIALAGGALLGGGLVLRRRSRDAAEPPPPA